jgi:hypothetical protein
MQRNLIFTVLFAGMILWANACRAEMAIALGMTDNINKDGFVWGGGFGGAARQQAIDICRGIKAPEVGKLPDNVPKAKSLCKIIADFSDSCFAIAQDGNVNKAATGVGWAVTYDLRSAEGQALAKCQAKAEPARRTACKVEYSHCDGSTN